MMIEPPTASPRTIEMALAARRMRTRGLAKKRRKPIRAAKRDSPTRLFGPWSRSRCFASAEVSPAEWLRAVEAGPAGACPRSGPASCQVRSCAAFTLGPCMLHAGLGECAVSGRARALPRAKDHRFRSTGALAHDRITRVVRFQGGPFLLLGQHVTLFRAASSR